MESLLLIGPESASLRQLKSALLKRGFQVLAGQPIQYQVNASA